MATHTPEQSALRAEARVPTAAPKWWTKRYTFLLAALVGVNLLTDWLGMRILRGGSLQVVDLFVIGHLLAQLFLMGVWLAFGGLHFVARFAVVTLVTLAGSLIVSNVDVDEIRMLTVMGGMIVFGTHALLVPLRWLLGWRVDFDRAYHSATSYLSMQLGLIHLLAFTTACTLPFALARLLPAGQSEGKLAAALFGGIGLCLSFPVSMVMIATRRRALWGFFAAAVFVSVTLIESVTMGGAFGGVSWGICFVNVASVATVFLNLGALRWVGLRLFSVKQAGTLSADTADQDLAQLVAGWPKLPDAVRQGIMATIRSANVDIKPSP